MTQHSDRLRKPIIVIGKRDVTAAETDALHTIGYGIAHVGNELHIPGTPGAPAIVADGYRAAGKEPTIHTAGLGNVDGETICLLDAGLVDKLDQRMPDWEERKWIVLGDEQMILDWAGAMVATLELTDRSLVAQ